MTEFYAWKDKILDYEIETCKMFTISWTGMSLEKIRFSITRLKQGNGTHENDYWNTWKDKILDYEIETCNLPLPFVYSRTHLKR